MKKVYTVYDSKAEMYHPPFYQLTRGLAIRAFTDLANDPSTDVGRHPEDYYLYEIGEYDESTAFFTQDNPPVSLGCAIEFVQPKDVTTPDMLRAVTSSTNAN